MTVFAGSQRKQWWGYTDIGPIQIPPNPQYLVLADRDTGQLWWVNYDPASGLVGINNVLPCNSPVDQPRPGQINPTPKNYSNCVVYDAFDEPIIGYLDMQNFFRMCIRSGVLGVSFESANPQMGTIGAMPLNLLPTNGILGLNQAYAVLMLAPGASSPVSASFWVGYTVYTLTQTPNPPPYRPSFNQQHDD